MLLLRLRFWACALVLSMLFGLLQATPKPNGHVLTNQAYIDGINKYPNLDIHSIPDVFSFVFNSLPSEVTVYPTENYFYFTFYYNGTPMAGNIRLDALDRDKGIAHFAYFSQYNMWSDESVSHYKKMGRKDGVKIKKLGPLRYRVSKGGKSVVFKLNDLSNVRPPKSKLRAGEQYIGPIYDESGIQFYLVYNPQIKLFHYILNDEVRMPDMLAVADNPNIFIGNRTGFAYYRDPLKRMILIGVYDGNSMVNNYFDGPFDQLPDNFINGNALQAAFIHQSPELKGQIDRFGNSDDGATRVMISPYIHYSHAHQLGVFSDCIKDVAKKGKNNNALYACLHQRDPDNHEGE